MKMISLRLVVRNRRSNVPMGLLVAMVILLPHQNTNAVPAPVDLDSASSFAVLAGTGITITGPTTITGDIGTFPTSSITGFQNVTLDGVNHADDAVTEQAKIDFQSAYNDAAGRPHDTTYVGGFDLAGLTLTTGVYNDASSLFLSGTLTLDAQGDPNAVWIFQAGSTLITASDSHVMLTGGAQACHVFWQIGSSATIGTDTDFVGNLLVLETITLNSRAKVDGRVLAQNGAVTLNSNTITKSDCNTSIDVWDTGKTLALLSFCFASMIALRHSKSQA